MSILDIDRNTGRKFGEAGSLQPGMLSSMQKRDAVAKVQSEMGRERSANNRLYRQLSRQSRRGNVRASMALVDFMEDRRNKGMETPGGLQSYEGNREAAASLLQDRAVQGGMMDAASYGAPSNYADQGQQDTTRTPASGPYLPGVTTDSRGNIYDPSGNKSELMSGGREGYDPRVLGSPKSSPLPPSAQNGDIPPPPKPGISGSSPIPEGAPPSPSPSPMPVAASAILAARKGTASTPVWSSRNGSNAASAQISPEDQNRLDAEAVQGADFGTEQSQIYRARALAAGGSDGIMGPQVADLPQVGSPGGGVDVNSPEGERLRSGFGYDPEWEKEQERLKAEAAQKQKETEERNASELIERRKRLNAENPGFDLPERERTKEEQSGVVDEMKAAWTRAYMNHYPQHRTSPEDMERFREESRKAQAQRDKEFQERWRRQNPLPKKDN